MHTTCTHRRLELAQTDRVTLVVHHEINKALDASRPSDLHKWQWCEKVILAGLQALKNDRSNDIAA